MGLTRTAALLTTDVRNRTDHISGSFRDDATIRQYLTESCRSLVMNLLSDYDELYWAQEAYVQTVADQQYTDLAGALAAAASPTLEDSMGGWNVWKIVMLRVTIDGIRDRIPESGLNSIDREGDSIGGWGNVWPKYRLIGSRFYWAPTPRAVHDVTVYFVPTDIFLNTSDEWKPAFTASTDKFDGIAGWEQWAVLDASIKLLNDEEKYTHAQALRVERDDRYVELTKGLVDRSISEPTRTQDTWRNGPRGSNTRIIEL